VNYVPATRVRPPSELPSHLVRAGQDNCRLEVVPDPATLATQAALRSLSERYAQAVDRRDGDAFAAVFLPEGRIRVFNPAEADAPIGQTVGRQALAGVPASVGARYTRTQHFLGQSTYEIGDGVATGEVYCLAHHLAPLPRGGASEYTMFIRYADRYRLGADRAWSIEERHVLVDWTETRTANPTGG
jgi:SnoaL-like protein